MPLVLFSLHACVLVLRRTGLATRVSASQNRDDPYHHPWLNPAAPGHMTSMRLAASYGVEIYRLQRPSIRAGSHLPSPDSFCVCRREPESPEEATPSIRRRATQARNLLGSPPPAPNRGVTLHRQSAYPRSRSAHETRHSGHCPAESAANSRPTPWSSSAHAGCRIW